jgi:hypothetical protein
LIGAQLTLSVAALIFSQGSNSAIQTSTSVYAVLLSVLNLSNATKNQKDWFSTFVQSYFSKIHNTLYFGGVAIFSCADNKAMQVLLGAFAVVMGINAATGVQILQQAYGRQSENSVIVENFLDEQVEVEDNKVKNYNDRLPTILKNNELSINMFNKGWKFDLFNVKG